MTIRFAVDNHVARVTIDRPDRMNAIDEACIDWLNVAALVAPRPLLFVNSDLASYLSGTNIVVDAGATAARILQQVATPAGLPGTKGA